MAKGPPGPENHPHEIKYGLKQWDQLARTLFCEPSVLDSLTATDTLSLSWHS